MTKEGITDTCILYFASLRAAHHVRSAKGKEKRQAKGRACKSKVRVLRRGKTRFVGEEYRFVGDVFWGVERVWAWWDARFNAEKQLFVDIDGKKIKNFLKKYCKIIDNV